MTSNGKNEQASYIYLGLAGETGRGRVVDSGLFRMADGNDEWEPLARGLPDMPAVRALAVHPQEPAIVYAGTQSGPYRSADRGEHWEKVAMPDHGLPVWSLLFHPHDPDVILIGTENCERPVFILVKPSIHSVSWALDLGWSARRSSCARRGSHVLVHEGAGTMSSHPKKERSQNSRQPE